MANQHEPPLVLGHAKKPTPKEIISIHTPLRSCNFIKFNICDSTNSCLITLRRQNEKLKEVFLIFPTGKQLK